MKYILGVSAYYHDSAAALLCDGIIVAAAQEERFSRVKHDARFPLSAIEYVLSEHNIGIGDLHHVVFYDKPFLKFERLLETYLAMVPRGFRSFRMAIPVWLKEKLFLKDMLCKEFKQFDSTFSPDKLLFSEHHISHAASAFFPSPFEEAVVLTLDGVGEWATTSVSLGKSNRLEMQRELQFPHSLGLLYSAFTYYCGFRVNSGEYKLMGLAPYGKPVYSELILDKLIDLKDDGSFRLDQSYFNYAAGLEMTSDKFSSLFGKPVRKADADSLEPFHMDLAASIQKVTEEIVLRMTCALAKEFDIPNLCMAGGVALNCVANGKILRDGAFKNIWIQPAAGDAGGSIGAALAAWHIEMDRPRAVGSNDSMQGSYLGPSYSDREIRAELAGAGAVFHKHLPYSTIEEAANQLARGCAVGWFQGRMEFGPRALGGRSILGDPRSGGMQKLLNEKIKFRESFRPFAPSILREDVMDWFDLEVDSPYMLMVAEIKESRRIRMTDAEKKLFGIDKLNVVRSDVPAVTQVDYTARVQTVHEDTHPSYHSLLKAFKRITGCPLLVNTSFNVRGEPIVCTPEDAFRCFMGTDMDVLVIGNSIAYKNEQDMDLAKNYESNFKLD